MIGIVIIDYWPQYKLKYIRHFYQSSERPKKGRQADFLFPHPLVRSPGSQIRPHWPPESLSPSASIGKPKKKSTICFASFMLSSLDSTKKEAHQPLISVDEPLFEAITIKELNSFLYATAENVKMD